MYMKTQPDICLVYMILSVAVVVALLLLHAIVVQLDEVAVWVGLLRWYSTSGWGSCSSTVQWVGLTS